MTATPYRVEYRGPNDWTVWTDEDGTHIRAPHGGGALEGPVEVDRLIQLVNEARAQHASGIIPAPKPADLPF